MISLWLTIVTLSLDVWLTFQLSSSYTPVLWNISEPGHRNGISLVNQHTRDFILPHDHRPTQQDHRQSVQCRRGYHRNQRVEDLCRISDHDAFIFQHSGVYSRLPVPWQALSCPWQKTRSLPRFRCRCCMRDMWYFELRLYGPVVGLWPRCVLMSK